MEGVVLQGLNVIDHMDGVEVLQAQVCVAGVCVCVCVCRSGFTLCLVFLAIRK